MLEGHDPGSLSFTWLDSLMVWSAAFEMHLGAEQA
jgi:hypothetical protein